MTFAHMISQNNFDELSHIYIDEFMAFDASEICFTYFYIVASFL